MIVASDDFAVVAIRCVWGRAVIVVGMIAFAASLTASAAGTGNLEPSAIQPRQEETIGIQMSKEQFRRMGQSDPALLGRSDATPVNVLVKLDYAPVANYEGNVPGLAATSPSKSGKKLRDNKAAVDAYTGYIAEYESKVLARIKDKVPAAKIRQSLRVVYGGLAITLPANNIGELLSIEGVVAVQQDSREKPLPAKPG